MVDKTNKEKIELLIRCLNNEFIYPDVNNFTFNFDQPIREVKYLEEYKELGQELNVIKVLDILGNYFNLFQENYDFVPEEKERYLLLFKLYKRLDYEDN